jgi:hypothetical protein
MEIDPMRSRTTGRLTARAGARAAVAAALIGIVSPAAAQVADGQALCFGRAFSADHLADPRNAGLTIVELLVVVDARHLYGVPDTKVTVRAMLRDQFGEFFSNDGNCSWNAGTAHYECGLASDGGTVEVALNADGSASLINTGGFGLMGAPVASGDIEGVRIPFDDAHAAFGLFPLPAEACPADLAAVFTYD